MFFFQDLSISSIIKILAAGLGLCCIVLAVAGVAMAKGRTLKGARRKDPAQSPAEQEPGLLAASHIIPSGEQNSDEQAADEWEHELLPPLKANPVPPPRAPVPPGPAAAYPVPAMSDWADLDNCSLKIQQVLLDEAYSHDRDQLDKQLRAVLQDMPAMRLTPFVEAVKELITREGERLHGYSWTDQELDNLFR